MEDSTEDFVEDLPLDEDDDEEEDDDFSAEEERGAESSDEDPVAEGDKMPEQDLEPSYEKANSLDFFTVCRRLEMLWKVTRGRTNKKVSLKMFDKLNTILPVKLLDHFSTPLVPGGRPESAFPLLRLLMPDKDASRYFNCKENALAVSYAGAFQLLKRPKGPYDMLANFRDPKIVDDSAAVGDFALVVKKVLVGRIVHDKTEKTGSDWTVGDINKFLDELANLKHKSVAAKASAQQQGSTAKTLKDLRIELFRELKKPRSKDGSPLSPLEHCWLVRIIQQDMRFGVGWRHVLKWYNKNAAALYDAHTSLKAICKTLCHPGFIGNHGQDLPEGEEETLSSYIFTSKATLTFGRPFKPMLSARTSFEKCLYSISNRHRSFLETQSDDGALRQSLTFRNPVFSVETKLDGERMIIHASQDGTIKIHSRVGNWYSELYSPVLGPALRRALAGKAIDVVLDGEILAYDAVRKETIPFGQNRTVANLRRIWMQRSGLIEDRDTLRHDADKHDNVISTNHVANRMHSSTDSELAGEECWLQFVAFDILYIDGPDAPQLLEETVSSHIQPRPFPGAINDLDGIERKRLLYRVLQEQKNEVQIVATWVIRPDGQLVEGADYFRFENPLVEFGHRVSDLDSLAWTYTQDKATILDLERKRRQQLSNSNGSDARASAVNEIYDVMVEDQRMEGLVLKDLSCPYYLGDESRRLAYWHKFKPDYHSGSSASDLDLVVIGAYFASGLRLAGVPSSFLCACVDSEDSGAYFPLCKVNAGSMRREVLDDLFASTGFAKDNETGSYDISQKWFKEEGRNMPDFITSRTYQPGVEAGWKARKTITPICEIVASDAFSAGITLRFPRVTALRSMSEKDASEVESEYHLWTIYQETLASRSDAVTGISCRLHQDAPLALLIFLSVLDRGAIQRNRKLCGEVETTRLAGMSFTVLEGIYFLDESFIYDDEAREGDWLDAARQVKSSKDLQIFIKKHSGRVHVAADGRSLVVGGRKDDARVVSYVQAINNAGLQVEGWKGKKPKTMSANKLERLAEQKGVLRWTYLFSLVYGPRSAGPKFMDYLVFASQGDDSTNSLVMNVCAEEIQTTKYLQRVLVTLSESNKRKSKAQSWQDQAQEFFAPTERWIVASRYQTLWPYSKPEMAAKRSEVFYCPPDDVTLLDEGSLRRATTSPVGPVYDSVLPLIRVMGARISFDLTADVTYVICDLVGGGDIAFTSDLNRDIFSDMEMGQALLGRLKRFCDQHAETGIRLISPAAIRKRKWNVGT